MLGVHGPPPQSRCAYLTALQTFLTSPSRCASRFSASSHSPIARTKPQMAYTWFSPGTARPFSSTLAMEIWTEPWSFALIIY